MARSRATGADGPPAGDRAGAHARVHALARMIPRGRVATYGQLAAMAGGCTPRMAGYAMAAVRPGDDVPWHRVINSQGRVSERPGAEVQRAMLEAEGVEFSAAGVIDLARFGWKGPGAAGGRRPRRDTRGGAAADHTEGDGMATSGFNGFSKQTVAFYSGLAKHNDKRWFEEHKQDYREHVIEPGVEFVRAMAAGLRKIAPEIVPDTRTNGAGSIFRIYRDTRFSKDKSPYKAYLGILLWDGRAKKMESRGFYFQLEPPKLMLAAGMYRFTPEQLAVYRKAVADPKSGPALKRAIAKVTAHPGIAIGEPHYKRVPRGFDPDHPRAELLKHNGMYCYLEEPVPAELTSPKLVEYCLARWKPMLPLHRWLDRVSG